MAETANGIDWQRIQLFAEGPEWVRLFAIPIDRKRLYCTYQKSQWWHRKRQERMTIDDYRCFMCRREDNLQVHHLTYDRVGDEDVENDLRTLCRACHAEIHNKPMPERVMPSMASSVLSVMNMICDRAEEAYSRKA